MTAEERQRLVRSYIGKTVHIVIDRPVGYVHKKENYSLTYPINYGYIPDILGGDGEELDVYLLGISEPVKEYTAKIIGAAYRKNDVEDKLIAAPFGMSFSDSEAYEAISFQEKWYDTEVRTSDVSGYPHFTVGIKENANYYHRPGAYIIPVKDSTVGLVKTKGGFCFIGGGLEKGEDDYNGLKREVLEETGYGVKIGEYFGSAEEYKDNQTDIGYFHPVQNYYIGTLTEKLAEPTEADHELRWLRPEDALTDMPIKMQKLALEEYIKRNTEK